MPVPLFFTRLTLHTSICVPPFEIQKQPNSTIASSFTHSATIVSCSLRHSRSLYTVSDCMCLCLFSHEGPEHNNQKEAVTSTSGPFWQQLLRRVFALVFVATGIRRFARFGLASFFGYQSVFSFIQFVKKFFVFVVRLHSLQCYSPRPLFYSFSRPQTHTHCCHREERLGTRREPSTRMWPPAISS